MQSSKESKQPERNAEDFSEQSRWVDEKGGGSMTEPGESEEELSFNNLKRQLAG